MKRIIIFFHIEKCGGTSLVHFFRNNLPFQSCEAVSKSNALSKDEWEKTLRAYPNLKVISGHNLQIQIIDWFRNSGFQVESFVILREPIERTISDYLHDRRKGTFDGDLLEYSKIPWKHNYISRFLGGGDATEASANLEKIDHAVPLSESAAFVTSLLSRHDLPARHPYAIANTANERLPDDVTVDGGVAIGKYRIAKDVCDALVSKNEADLALWSYIEKQRASSRSADKEHGKPPTNGRAGWLPKLATVHRNVVYKPSVGVWSKYYALPRNRVDPRTASAADAFR